MTKNNAIKTDKLKCETILQMRINEVLGYIRVNKMRINELANSQKVLKKEIKTLYKLRLK